MLTLITSMVVPHQYMPGSPMLYMFVPTLFLHVIVCHKTVSTHSRHSTIQKDELTITLGGQPYVPPILIIILPACNNMEA